MIDRKKSDHLLGVLLLLIAGKGGNWLLTPMRHPQATTLDYILTWGQLIVSIAAGIWLLRRARAQPRIQA